MFSLFSTGSHTAGFRLQYMQLYNWGIFHNKIFPIRPEGNNSLLTGANGSGKSTYMDALLTLLVPIRKLRFYNQSSGDEKKGNRTEESYVLGNYGHIQYEGDSGTTTQSLRNQSCYSVLLASFSNTDQKIVTLFQVRWFSNDELKRTFGIAHLPLNIDTDFSEFDKNGNWRKRLDKKLNANSTKRKIEFFDGPTSYAERIIQLFGMRSMKALSLLNQIMGVKVLENLNDFIRIHMLEERDAENEYIQLKKSFQELTGAKKNIEKAKEQIAQLTPIHEHAEKIEQLRQQTTEFEKKKELAAYWFAQRHIQLGKEEIEKTENLLTQKEKESTDYEEKEQQLGKTLANLHSEKERDEASLQIKHLELEISNLTKNKENKIHTLDKYNQAAQKANLPTNPDKETFYNTLQTIKKKQERLDNQNREKNRLLGEYENKQDKIKDEISTIIETIQTLQRNKNNIPSKEAEIRDNILQYVKATKQEIPFTSELVKVDEKEKEWERVIEKVLHNWALRLLVPSKYYAQVNEYVNQTNLKGRITYQRFENTSSLSHVNTQLAPNSLINKLILKTTNPYTDFLKESLIEQYNYTCVENIEEFNRYKEKAVTREGLIKYTKGRHEKDDRSHFLKKENYILGWDNTEKINHLQSELKKLHKEETNNNNEIEQLKIDIQKIEEQKKNYFTLTIYNDYDSIDWNTYAIELQEKIQTKKTLETSSNRLEELQKQISEIEVKLIKTRENKKSTSEKFFRLKMKIEDLKKSITENKELLQITENINLSEFEKSHPNILTISYTELNKNRDQIQQTISDKLKSLHNDKTKNEDQVKDLIRSFKNPSAELLNRYPDWSSDVNSLPDATYLDLISDYKIFLDKLKKDALPKFEQKFNKYLQETISHKIGDFRMFFENWLTSIQENIQNLNDTLQCIDFKDNPIHTFIQLVATNRINEEVQNFRHLLYIAIPNFQDINTIDAWEHHFHEKVYPLIQKLEQEEWRKKVMDVRNWLTYKAEEFYKETKQKFNTYENMGQLSGGEKAQLTYTILGSAIAYQFGLTKEGLQSNSFRFIAIDEAFKAQDEERARFLINLCKQLHLQFLVVTPNDNIHIVENDISFVHYVEKKDDRQAWLYNMPIEQFQEEKSKYITT